MKKIIKEKKRLILK